jgi:hypothetical protein
VTFNPISAPIDYVVLAGRRSPGLAELQGFGTPRRWDERRGYGNSGGTLIYRGVALARGKLLLRLISDQDFEDWAAWSELVQRAPLGERARALDISHPILEDLGIRSVVVEDVKQPTQTADGEWTIEIPLIEYRPPQRALSRPDGSEDRPPEPADNAERGLQTLTGVLNRVAAGGELPVRELLDGLALAGS